MFPQTPYLLYDEPSWWGKFLSQYLGYIAGVYVIVRGLDNIERGLSPAERSKWRPIFYGETSTESKTCAPLDTPVIFDSPARMRWAEGMRLDRRSHTASSRHVLRCRVAIWVAETP